VWPTLGSRTAEDQIRSNTGITLAFFILVGTFPVYRERLKIYSSGSIIAYYIDFTSFGPKLSGPEDLFFELPNETTNFIFICRVGENTIFNG